MPKKSVQFDRQMEARQDASAYTGALDLETMQALKDIKTSGQLETVIKDKQVRTGAFLWTPTGLRVEGEVTQADWQYTGEILRRMQVSLSWIIGDFCNTSEELGYGDYKAIAEAFGFKEATLYQYKYVASKVQFELRFQELSFAHHQVVAGMLEGEQRYWLQYALDNQLSVSKMRQAINPPAPSSQNHALDMVNALEKRINSMKPARRAGIISALEALLDRLRG